MSNPEWHVLSDAAARARTLPRTTLMLALMAIGASVQAAEPLAADAPEVRVRVLLERSKERLRRLELDRLRESIAEAQEATERLSPGAEARRLYAELLLVETQLRMIERDEDGQGRAMALLLSLDPEIELDPTAHSPPMLLLLAEAKRKVAESPRMAMAIETVPPGARVFIGGANHGLTPLVLRDFPKSPVIVWFAHPTHEPHVARVDPDERVAIALRTRSRETKSVDEPVVNAAPSPPSATDPPHEPTEPTHNIAPALGLLGVAVATLAAAIVFGVRARDGAERANQQRFASDGASLSDRAQSDATVANVLYGGAAAAVGLAAGAWFVF